MDQGDFNRIKRYLFVVARGIFAVVFVFLLTLLAGQYVARHFLPTIYEATAEIESPPPPSPDLATDGSGTIDPAQFPAEMQMIESPREVLFPVIEKLGLDRIWNERLSKSGHQPLSMQEAVTRLARMLRVNLQPETNVIDITAASVSPKEASDIANAVAEQYKSLRDRAVLQQMEQAQDAVKLQMVQRQQQIYADKQAALEKAKQALQAKGIQISPQPTGPESSDLQSYRAAERDLAAQRDLLDAVNTQLKQMNGGEDSSKESSVRILSWAKPALDEANAKRRLHKIVILVVATFLAVSIASSVEVLFLLSRASQRPENY